MDEMVGQLINLSADRELINNFDYQLSMSCSQAKVPNVLWF